MCSKGNQSQTSQIGSCRHRLPISLKTANSATVGTVQYIQNAHCFTKDATSDRFRLLARNSVIVGSIGYISFDGPCITILGHFPPRPNAIGYWHRQDKSPGREHEREREREREREMGFPRKMCLHSIDDDDGRPSAPPHQQYYSIPQFPVSHRGLESGPYSTYISPRTAGFRPLLRAKIM